MTTEDRVKASIATDLREHVITTLHADGLYRHYRCSRPNSDSGSHNELHPH